MAVRLVAIVVVVLTVVAVAGFAAVVVAFRVPGLFPAESSLRVVRLVALDVGRARASGDLSREVARIARSCDLDLTVIAPDGVVIARDGPAPRLSPDDLAAALRGVSVLRGFELYVGAPVVERGVATAAVVVRFRNPSLTRFPLRGALVAALMVALTAALTRALSRSITRRLEALARAARGFAAGDLTRRSEVEGDDELGELGRAFDTMAARIERRRREEREVLAGVSHELRSPVARLRVRLGLLDAEPGALGAVEAELDDIDRMVSDVLLATSLEQGVRALAPRWTQLRPLVARSRERLAVLYPDHEVRVEVPEDLYVCVDAGLFAHVLDNLFDNAVKHSRVSAALEVRASQRGGAVCVEVEDGGEGIPEAEVARVVEPFTRGSRAGGRGWGVGLALCRSIIEAHGGSLAIDRGARGGARVRVTLAAPPEGQ